jgi:hypothetical protein
VLVSPISFLVEGGKTLFPPLEKLSWKTLLQETGIK